LMLWDRIRDLMPWRFHAHPDVTLRLHLGVIIQSGQWQFANMSNRPCISYLTAPQ
jgi:hypothetical protein